MDEIIKTESQIPKLYEDNYCFHCGNVMTSEAKYCSKCGKSINREKINKRNDIIKDIQFLWNNSPVELCKRCGKVYRHALGLDRNTYYLGQYGCEYEDCHIIRHVYLDQNCPTCDKELRMKLDKLKKQYMEAKEKITNQFWHEKVH